MLLYSKTALHLYPMQDVHLVDDSVRSSGLLLFASLRLINIFSTLLFVRVRAKLSSATVVNKSALELPLRHTAWWLTLAGGPALIWKKAHLEQMTRRPVSRSTDNILLSSGISSIL